MQYVYERHNLPVPLRGPVLQTNTVHKSTFTVKCLSTFVLLCSTDVGLKSQHMCCSYSENKVVKFSHHQLNCNFLAVLHVIVMSPFFQIKLLFHPESGSVLFGPNLNHAPARAVFASHLHLACNEKYISIASAYLWCSHWDKVKRRATTGATFQCHGNHPSVMNNILQAKKYDLKIPVPSRRTLFDKFYPDLFHSDKVV